MSSKRVHTITSFAFLVIFCFGRSTLFAQVDSNFIEILPNQRVLGGVLQIRDFKVKYEPKDNPTQYHQITDLGVGIRFKRNKIGATLVLPIMRLNNPGKIKPTALGLRIRWYPKQFFIFGIFQRVNGMYESNALSGDIYNPNAKLRFGSVNVMYLSNAKRFNMKSTFRAVNLQKKSAGSLVANSLMEYQYFMSNSGRVDSGINGLASYIGWRASLDGGYAYTYVINGFQLTGLSIVGPEIRNVNVAQNNEQQETKLIKINPRIMFMGSIAYNTKHFFANAVAFYHPGILKNEIVNVNTETSRVRLTIGWRFD